MGLLALISKALGFHMCLLFSAFSVVLVRQIMDFGDFIKIAKSAVTIGLPMFSIEKYEKIA